MTHWLEWQILYQDDKKVVRMRADTLGRMVQLDQLGEGANSITLPADWVRQMAGLIKLPEKF